MGDSCLEDVLIDEQLVRRELRVPRMDLEIEALQHLMQHFVLDSQSFLDEVVETACRLCDGDSAGVSLEETLPDGTKVVRWIAATGLLLEAKGECLPREKTPCATVMDRNSPQLIYEPHRVFTAIPEKFFFREGLLVPCHVHDELRGTLWVVSHRNGKQFDREDVRLLESLRSFAQAAVWKDQIEGERREQSSQAAAAELADALAHKINNPLQALTHSLQLLSDDEHKGVLEQAKAELARISKLVQRIPAQGAPS